MANVGTAAAGKTLIGAGNGVSPTFADIGTNSGLTSHGFLIAQGTGAFQATAAPTNGQIPIGFTGSNPVLALPISSDSSITISGGAGTLNLMVNGGTTVGKTITGNSGGALSPTAGNWNVLGTGSITNSGAGSTLTVQLTGLTNHNVLIGAGSATITKVAPSATSGVPLISNGAAADPSFGTATVPGGGTGAVSFTAHSLLLGQGTSAVTALGAASNGQLPIGSTGADPVLATLSAGAGISISNGAGSITISASGGGLTWTDITGSTQTLAINNGYVTNRGGGVTYTLPATATEGDIIRVAGKSGAWSIAQNANQQINVGSSSSTTGVTGSIASTNAGDCVEMLCTTGGTSTIWRVISSMGNITVA